MQDAVFTIKENGAIAKNVFRLVLAGDTSQVTAAGQFVNVSLPGFFLRRPISVADAGENELTLIFKTVGQGTDALSKMPAGTALSVLTGLGNGYDLSKSGERPLLLGGGVGVPPLYLLAKKLRVSGKDVSVVLGFNTKEEIFYEDEFRALGCHVTVATADGSYGVKGFVTDALPEGCTYFYTCGPLPMLKAVYRTLALDGEFSLEERMGCGFGACMGCSVRVKGGYKRVCKDGPVFKKEELLWEG
ncbi:MAG: dihydroorotate dehydrogenase electron transfer subunit [Lachnospiraceae bacterium]|nr:dihydroorotate dehydrogenase electron transfer subunit [Lachnospiraceae bacterium]